MKVRAMIFILFAVLFSCKKDHKVTVTGLLTDCPANSTCTYNYYDQADFTASTQLGHGDYRVFVYKSVNSNVCSITSEFYFKTSLSNDDFEISSNQIASGQVFANNLICPCCDIAILTKPIGGDIKGTKTDPNHWLVNASIIFGTSFSQATDTLKVNQYFTLTKLP